MECGINAGLDGLHVRHKLEASHTQTQDIDGFTSAWQPPAVAWQAAAAAQQAAATAWQARLRRRTGRRPRPCAWQAGTAAWQDATSGIPSGDSAGSPKWEHFRLHLTGAVGIFGEKPKVNHFRPLAGPRESDNQDKGCVAEVV